MPVTRTGRELLPRVFTLTEPKPGGIFSVALSVIPLYAKHPRFHKVGYSVLPGLSSPNNLGAIERLAYCKVKQKTTPFAEKANTPP